MNAYDFDKTIFDGDSTQRFLFFLLKRDFRLVRCVPRVMLSYAEYLLGGDKTHFKEKMYRCAFPKVRDIDGAVSDFWKENLCRVKKFYLAQKQQDDAIITASPEFLVAPACRALGIPDPIGSRVNPKTGDYDGKNCHGAEKVTRFRQVYGNVTPEAFYSDSLSDAPMAKISKKAYLVKGESLKDWP